MRLRRSGSDTSIEVDDKPHIMIIQSLLQSDRRSCETDTTNCDADIRVALFTGVVSVKCVSRPPPDDRRCAVVYEEGAKDRGDVLLMIVITSQEWMKLCGVEPGRRSSII